MMLNAKSVDHLPYRRHVYIAKSKGPRIEPRGTPEASFTVSHLSAPTATYCDICDEGLYPSTDGTADGKVRVDACTKDRVVNGIERGRDIERE